MLPTVVPGDVLLFFLLGPEKSAAVLAREAHKDRATEKSAFLDLFGGNKVAPGLDRPSPVEAGMEMDRPALAPPVPAPAPAVPPAGVDAVTPKPLVDPTGAAEAKPLAAPSWLSRNQDWLLPAGLGAGGLLAGALYARHKKKKEEEELAAQNGAMKFAALAALFAPAYSPKWALDPLFIPEPAAPTPSTIAPPLAPAPPPQGLVDPIAPPTLGGGEGPLGATPGLPNVPKPPMPAPPRPSPPVVPGIPGMSPGPMKLAGEDMLKLPPTPGVGQKTLAPQPVPLPGAPTPATPPVTGAPAASLTGLLSGPKTPAPAPKVGAARKSEKEEDDDTEKPEKADGSDEGYEHPTPRRLGPLQAMAAARTEANDYPADIKARAAETYSDAGMPLRGAWARSLAGAAGGQQRMEGSKYVSPTLRRISAILGDGAGHGADNVAELGGLFGSPRNVDRAGEAYWRRIHQYRDENNPYRDELDLGDPGLLGRAMAKTPRTVMNASDVVADDAEIAGHRYNRANNPLNYWLNPLVSSGPLNELATRLSRRGAAEKADPDATLRSSLYVPGVPTLRGLLGNNAAKRDKARDLAQQAYAHTPEAPAAPPSALDPQFAQYWGPILNGPKSPAPAPKVAVELGVERPAAPGGGAVKPGPVIPSFAGGRKGTPVSGPINPILMSAPKPSVEAPPAPVPPPPVPAARPAPPAVDRGPTEQLDATLTGVGKPIYGYNPLYPGAFHPNNGQTRELTTVATEAATGDPVSALGPVQNIFDVGPVHVSPDAGVDIAAGKTAPRVLDPDLYRRMAAAGYHPAGTPTGTEALPKPPADSFNDGGRPTPVRAKAGGLAALFKVSAPVPPGIDRPAAPGGGAAKPYGDHPECVYAPMPAITTPAPSPLGKAGQIPVHAPGTSTLAPQIHHDIAAAQVAVPRLPKAPGFAAPKPGGGQVAGLTKANAAVAALFGLKTAAPVPPGSGPVGGAAKDLGTAVAGTAKPTDGYVEVTSPQNIPTVPGGPRPQNFVTDLNLRPSWLDASRGGGPYAHLLDTPGGHIALAEGMGAPTGPMAESKPAPVWRAPAPRAVVPPAEGKPIATTTNLTRWGEVDGVYPTHPPSDRYNTPSDSVTIAEAKPNPPPGGGATLKENSVRRMVFGKTADVGEFLSRNNPLSEAGRTNIGAGVNEWADNRVAGGIKSVTGGQSPADMFTPDVGNFLDKNRWANYAAWGLPIGAGVGLLSGLMNRKKKRDAMGDALSGGLLGAAAGGLGGAVLDLNKGQDAPPPTPPPTPVDPTRSVATPGPAAALPDPRKPGLASFLDKSRVDGPGAVEQLRANATGGPATLRGRAGYEGHVGALNNLLPLATPESRTAFQQAHQQWEAANAATRQGLKPGLLGGVGAEAARGATANLDTAWTGRQQALRDLLRAGPSSPVSTEAWNAAAGPVSHFNEGPNPIVLDDNNIATGVEGRSALGAAGAVGAARGARNLATGHTLMGTEKPETAAGRLLATARGEAAAPSLRKPWTYLTNTRPLSGADAAADSGLVGRVTAATNAGTTGAFTSPDEVRKAVGAINPAGVGKDGRPGVPRAPSAVEAKVREAVGQVAGGAPAVVGGAGLAKNKDFISGILSRAGFDPDDPRSPFRQKSVADFLRTGTSGAPTLDKTIKDILAAKDGPFAGAQVETPGALRRAFGAEPLQVRPGAAAPGSVATRLLGGAKGLVTGAAKNIAVGGAASLGMRHGTDAVPRDQTAIEALKSRLAAPPPQVSVGPPPPLPQAGPVVPEVELHQTAHALFRAGLAPTYEAALERAARQLAEKKQQKAP